MVVQLFKNYTWPSSDSFLKSLLPSQNIHTFLFYFKETFQISMNILSHLILSVNKNMRLGYTSTSYLYYKITIIL